MFSYTLTAEFLFSHWAVRLPGEAGGWRGGRV